MSTLTLHDNWDDTADTDARVIQGGLIRCVDGHWSDRDKIAIPPNTRLLAMSTLTLLQRWENNRPTDTIFAEAGKPLPDIEQLNAAIPHEKWEVGLNGEPRPPWQRQQLVLLLSPTTAEKFTFINSTTGARLAVESLKDKVR